MGPDFSGPNTITGARAIQVHLTVMQGCGAILTKAIAWPVPNLMGPVAIV
uniref:Uncharacterized protein n=1 Tax=Caenorhabditis brenneri TaxID=135651 RepID=B6VBQ7_CAEBE|nr:hypothetical protein Cbre_JD20.005 [Caenorhabditis brenneri]